MIEVIGWNEECVRNALKLGGEPVFTRFYVPEGRFNAARRGYDGLVRC